MPSSRAEFPGPVLVVGADAGQKVTGLLPVFESAVCRPGISGFCRQPYEISLKVVRSRY